MELLPEVGLGFVVRQAPIDVVLPTYNGVLFLEAQLASIHAQTLRPVRVLLRDDGSRDGTLELIQRLQKCYGSWLQLLPADTNLGCTANVNILLQASQAPYIALADQDDIWLPHKLEESLALMQQLEACYGAGIPVLVHSDLELIDVASKSLGHHFFQRQHLDPQRTAPRDLTLTNVVTGCTALMNRSLLEIALPIPTQAVMHDWWLALVASVFGRIELLPQATVRYRQHGNNVLGAQGLGLGYWWRRFQCWAAQPAAAGTLRAALEQAQCFEERYGRSAAALPALMQLPRRQRWLALCRLPPEQRLRKHGPLRSLILLLALLVLPR